MGSRVSRGRFCALVIAAVCAVPAHAVVVPEEVSRFDRLVVLDPSTEVGQVAERPEAIADYAVEAAGWDRFRAEHGGSWDVHVDRRSGTALLVQGSGIRWYDPDGPAPTLAALEARARSFLAPWSRLLRIDPAQLVLSTSGSAANGPDSWVLLFDRVLDGIPVEGQRLRFFVNRGNMVAFGADRWAEAHAAPRALVSADTARQLLYLHMGILPRDVVTELDGGTAVLVAGAAPGTAFAPYRGAAGRGTTLHLAYRFTLEVEGERGRWTGKIDAVTGEVLALYDTLRYAHVKGGVYPISNNGVGVDGIEQADFPMPYARVTVDGVQQTSSAMGTFACDVPGTAATTSLAGPYVRISDSCGAVNEVTICDSDLDLETGPAGQTNCAVPAGSSAGNTHAARSAYYNVARVNERGRHWLPGNAWLNGQVNVNANLNSTCNATWGGSLNMYRAGNGCGNTSEIAGILVHEWGHGLDENDGGGYDNTSEGYGDVTAAMYTHESCLGRGFDLGGGNCGNYGDVCLDCTGVRDSDWNKRAAHTPATPQVYAANNCPSGGGPCGKEEHCEGVIGAEAMWDLAARDLPASGLDPATAWHVAEKLWFKSRQGSGGNAYNCSLPSSDGCNAGSWYNDLRNADDDDGNLANGTPHAAAIFAAFARHNIACGLAGDATNQSASACAALATPSVTSTAGDREVTLQWAAVPNATSYAILRNDVGCLESHHVIATVADPATSYVDTGLPNGLNVFYAVHAIGAASACESTLSTCQSVIPLPRRGEILLDRGRYGCGQTMQIKLRDLDLNVNPGVAETVQVRVSSSSEFLGETITLTETGPSTAQFTGTIATTSGAVVPGNGLVETADGDLLTVVYADADDGTGAPATIIRSVDADCSGPAISNVRVTDIKDDSVIVRWDTVEASSSRVEWGLTTALGTIVNDAALVTTHAVTVKTVPECGRAYFRVSSTDAQGNAATQDAQGAPFAFSTNIIPSFHKETFEAAAGWTFEGEWQIQAPMGLGTGPDPNAAFEGTKVLGHDLSGLGTRPGNYEAGTNQRASSPIINATALAGGRLKFRRWLNVTGTASSFVEIRKNGVWNTVWTSPGFSGVSESAWSFQTIDISAFADGNSQLQIGFRQTGGNASSARAGWNVDRLILSSASQPDFQVCGGCAAAPSFSGAASATDLDGCGDTGVRVAWAAAAAWGSGGAGTYAVYRDTDPGFLPAAGNRIASGVTGTSYDDLSAPNGVALYYVVQAENAETCASGPNNGGVVDGNTVRIQAQDALGQPALGAITAMTADNENDAHVRLAWPAAANATAYRVYRADAPAGPFTQLAETTGNLFEDEGEIPVAASRYYTVRPVNACGVEGP